MLSTLAGQPGSEEWDDPANQPPGHLGISALHRRRRTSAIASGRSCRAIGLFETTDDGATWTPRNRGLRADWPRPHEEVGFCVHKVVRSPTDRDRMYQQNHVGMHRSDDCGQTWTEITEGLPTEFGFAAGRASARPRHVLRRPARPGARPHDARREGRRLAHARRRLELAACRHGLPERDAYIGVLREGMANDTYDVAGLLLRHQHRPAVRERTTKRERWDEIASYLPRDLLGRSRDRRLTPWPSCTSR